MLATFLGHLVALFVAFQFYRFGVAAGVLNLLGALVVFGVADVSAWAARRVAGGRGQGKGKP